MTMCLVSIYSSLSCCNRLLLKLSVFAVPVHCLAELTCVLHRSGKVLIMSAHTDCERAPAEYLAGGDYDGDEVIIIADEASLSGRSALAQYLGTFRHGLLHRQDIVNAFEPTAYDHDIDKKTEKLVSLVAENQRTRHRHEDSTEVFDMACQVQAGEKTKLLFLHCFAL